MHKGIGALLQSARELDLTTTGRASGQPRTVEPWFAYEEGYVYFLAGLDASGTTTHWRRNLQAHPYATVTVGGQAIPVRLEQGQDTEALRRHVLALFRKKYGAATMRQWYDEKNQLPLRLRVVDSVRSAVGQNKEKMTRRIIKAMQNPDVTVIGRPAAPRRQTRKPRAASSAPTTAEQRAALEVVDDLRRSIRDGAPWPRSLLEAIGRWPLAQEEMDGVQHKYFLMGEAFDWMALAGRLLAEVDGLVPAEEKEALLFSGVLPDDIPWSDFQGLVGSEKYRAHLNYFYGVVVEDALILAVEDAIRKERRSLGLPDSEELTNAAYHRIYGATQRELLAVFREELGREDTDSITITELKEFTYWLFKRRLNRSDGARLASDTRRGLERLARLHPAT